jgi:hypothetical protein
MDTKTLVKEQLDAGAKLVEQLPQNGFEVSAAFWLKGTENGQWRFYIVSPLVETAGFGEAHRQLEKLLRQMPESLWIRPLNIWLIGPTDPIAQDVLEFLRRIPSHWGGPIPWEGITLGRMSVEDAFLYRPPVAASS